MSNLRQAAQRALEALENAYMVNSWAWVEQKEHVITALRAALAEPEQNPFGDDAERYARKLHEEREAYKALFTAPTPRKPLTNEEISAILDDTLEGGSFFDVALAVARAIERAHGIGEED